MLRRLLDSLRRLRHDPRPDPPPFALHVIVPGEPVANKPQRARRGTPTAKNPSGITTYKPADVKNWQARAADELKAEWGDWPPYDGPVIVWVTAVFTRPKKLMRKKDSHQRILCGTGKDVDNLAKCSLDALQWAGVLRNDSRVFRLIVEKWWAAMDEAAHVEIEVM